MACVNLQTNPVFKPPARRTAGADFLPIQRDKHKLRAGRFKKFD